MSFAHLTLPSQHVQNTASFLEQTLGYSRDPVPPNVPIETVWLNIGRGQQIHVFYVEGFEVSPFENEFGRHIALFYPLDGFEGLKDRLRRADAQIFDALRPTPFERFFFREPINGYVFEVIEEKRSKER